MFCVVLCPWLINITVLESATRCLKLCVGMVQLYVSFTSVNILRILAHAKVTGHE